MVTLDTAAWHRETFRRSVPIRAGAYGVFFGVCWALDRFAIQRLPIGAMAAWTIGETIVLACVYRRALASPRWAAAFLCFEAVCQTMLLHLIGNLRLFGAPFVYTMQLINPGLRLGRRGDLVTANGFAALYLLMSVAEANGWLASRSDGALVASPELMRVEPLVVWICLNVAALFFVEGKYVAEAMTLELARAKENLQRYSAELEDRVRERTAEVELHYRALQARSAEQRAFVFDVTHELRNRVSPMLLTADRLLRNGDGLVGKVRAAVQHIAEMASGTEQVLDDLLRAFRVSLASEPNGSVDLGALVQRSLVHHAVPIAAKRAQVSIGTLPLVWGQAEKLSYVVANVLGNAVKYVSAGHGRIEIGGCVDGDWSVFWVRDNGIGIATHYHQGIFKIFNRVPAEEQLVDGVAPAGTGLGLSTVQRIVEAHGGSVSIESAPGAGTCVRVRLPGAFAALRERAD